MEEVTVSVLLLSPPRRVGTPWLALNAHCRPQCGVGQRYWLTVLVRIRVSYTQSLREPFAQARVVQRLVFGLRRFG